MRKNTQFHAEDGTVLRGWWYTHEDGKPHPGIIMAHGFSGTKEMFLDNFASTFHSAGFEVLVYDHRNWGESDKPVPGEIDPTQQIRDYRDAITWFSQQSGVDANRIGIWGSSYAGGHVLVVAAVDRRVRCVVSQVPLISGRQTARHLIRADHWPALRAGFDADRQARLAGEAPATLPVTWENAADEPCALPTADTHDFFLGPENQEMLTHWQNEVTLRSMELFTEYEPHIYIDRISPTPLLLVLARDDVLVESDIALKAYETALQPKKLLILECGHFDAYDGVPFEVSGAEQTQWFSEHLLQ